MPDDTLNPVVGIDLGTTYSSIARWDGERIDVYRMHDGQESIPSIVHIQDSGTPLVGEMARPRLMTDPSNTVEKAKRFIGDETKVYTLRGKPYTPVDISSLVLQRLKQDVEKRYPKTAGFDIAGAVITHPHYFKFPQIARTQEAAVKAGLPVLRLASEPVAAALDYGFTNYSRMEKTGSEKILVFDLGGGTFDVTVIEVINEATKLTFKVLATGGDDMLGGTNFDEALAQWALNAQGIKFDGLKPEAKSRAVANLMEQVIKTKRELSSVDSSYLTVPNILPGQHMELEITRAQFNKILEPSCERIRRILSDTLTTARLRSGELNKSLMIGGSSLIPVMEDIVREETGVDPWADADRHLAVCRGAAFLAAMDDGRVTKKEIVIEEVTAHALGVRAAGNVFSVMIPANRAAPVQATRIYTVKSSSFEVQPFQGHGRLVTEPTVTALKPISITGVRLGPNGDADVKITFSVNNQQILFVKIEAPGVSEQRQLEV
ncbi:MAG: Hsp70 family protein [Planctomycetes bacterium]|nr:Hsp70 family protein [Planctomycetota bacterium]